MSERPELKFIGAVASRWGTLVTGGVLIGLVTLWQNTGHAVSHHVYWTIGIGGLGVACYRAWQDEFRRAESLMAALRQHETQREEDHQKIVSLATALEQKMREQGRESQKQLQDRKRELVQALTSLRATEQELRNWLDLTDNKWGMAPPSVKLLPDDWGNVVYTAGTVSDDVRSDLDSFSSKLSEANSLIGRFLGMNVNFRDQRLMPPAHNLLNQSAPLLSKVIVTVEAHEKSLR